MRINWPSCTTTRAVTLGATPLFVGASCTGDDRSQASPSSKRVRVVLDYSPTLSDAGALLYLASVPEVELLAVTLPGTGESDCDVGVRTTRSLLAIAGRPNVPVGCGRDAPLVGHRDWPEEWRAEVNRCGDEMLAPVGVLPALDAEPLLVDTLSHTSTPVTIVAVAPLTNLGVVLPTHPEFADMVAAMNGADGRLSQNTSDVYTSLETSALSPRESASAFVDGFLDAVDTNARELKSITPPATIRAVHAEYLEILAQVLDSKEELIAALAEAAGADTAELLQNATAMTSLPGLFDQQRKLCQTLEDYSLRHDGPRPCSSAADQ